MGAFSLIVVINLLNRSIFEQFVPVAMGWFSWLSWVSSTTAGNEAPVNNLEARTRLAAVQSKESIRSKEEELIKFADIPSQELALVFGQWVGLVMISTFPPCALVSYFAKKTGQYQTALPNHVHLRLLRFRYVPFMVLGPAISCALCLRHYEFEKSSTIVGQFIRQEEFYDKYMFYMLWPIWSKLKTESIQSIWSKLSLLRQKKDGDSTDL